MGGCICCFAEDSKRCRCFATVGFEALSLLRYVGTLAAAYAVEVEGGRFGFDYSVAYFQCAEIEFPDEVAVLHAQLAGVGVGL